jgi:hypothetical protein
MEIMYFIIGLLAGLILGYTVAVIAKVNKERDEYEQGFTDGMKHVLTKAMREAYPKRQLPDINDIKLQ